MAATALIAVVGVSLAEPFGTGEEPSPSPASSALPSGRPQASPSASPIVAPTWELRQLSLPPERAGDFVAGVSSDGGVVLVVEPMPFWSLSTHLITSAGVRELVVPDHRQGAPIGAQLSPDGRFVIVSELGQLWRYDVAAMTYEPLPSPPDSLGANSWALGEDDRMLVLSGPLASFEFGGVTDTRLWSFDLEMLEYTELGARYDGIGVYPTADGGAVLLADHSPQHDNTGWALYRIAADGFDQLLYDIGSNHGSVSALAVAVDGSAIAFALPAGGTLIVEASSGEARQVSDGQVIDFSPDARLLRVLFSDDHVEAVDRHGTVVKSLSSAATGWVRMP